MDAANTPSNMTHLDESAPSVHVYAASPQNPSMLNAMYGDGGARMEMQPHTAYMSAMSPYASPFLGPASSAAASPFLSPYGYMYATGGGGSMSQQPSPYLQPMSAGSGLSPTLSAVSSAPTSPKMASVAAGAGLLTSSSWNNLQIKSAYDAFTENMTEAQLSTNVYIRGLSPTMSDEGLLALCSSFGQIVSSKSIIDTKTSECKGFGFAMYASEDQARYAIQQLNAQGYQASFAKESFSARLKNLQDPTSTNIYLSNLPLDIDETRLDELFKPYKIVSGRILRDASGVSRGVGFARMESRDSALAIIQKFNGYFLAGHSVPLQVRFADSAAQKKLKSQTQRKRQWRAQESKMSQSYMPTQQQQQQSHQSYWGDGTQNEDMSKQSASMLNVPGMMMPVGNGSLEQSFTPQLGPAYAAFPAAAAAGMMANMYNQAAMATYAAAYSPYMQPQMLASMQPYAAYGYAPTSQLPVFTLPETTNGSGQPGYAYGDGGLSAAMASLTTGTTPSAVMTNTGADEQ